MKKKALNFYQIFKNDTPQLSFKYEDKEKIKFEFDTYGRWDTTDEEIEAHRNGISKAIEELKKDAKVAPELKYLIKFLKAYLKMELQAKDEWEIEIDLNKLKYCKTLIAYIKDEYSEDVLSTIDYLQDLMVDEIEIDKDRVFFLPSSQSFAVVRKVILSEGDQVPLAEGDTYFGESYPLQYRWKDGGDDVFEVMYNGKWLEAYSIDFEFPYEHLRVE